MQKLRFILAAALAIAGSAAALAQSSTSGPWANNQLPQLAYASLPAASSVPSGVRFTATDLGSNGTDLVSNGTRWRPVGGSAMLASLGAPAAGIANVETIVLQTKIPVGAWQTNDTIRVWFVPTKSGTTDTASMSVHIGTAGTTADTTLAGFSVTILAATSVGGGGVFDIKLLSATSAQKMGVNGTGNATYSSLSTTQTAPAATVITDASANALWVTVTLLSSGTTNTVGMSAGQIQLITP